MLSHIPLLFSSQIITQMLEWYEGVRSGIYEGKGHLAKKILVILIMPPSHQLRCFYSRIQIWIISMLFKKNFGISNRLLYRGDIPAQMKKPSFQTCGPGKPGPLASYPHRIPHSCPNMSYIVYIMGYGSIQVALAWLQDLSPNSS